jgi:hypothetical protein
LSAAALVQLAARAVYVGSGHHKRYPADYGFDRVNPVPTKSICDLVAPVLLPQAKGWLRDGIMKGMISVPVAGDYPKYIWCVADDGRVFEAKTDPHTPGRYHGYPLEGEDDMKDYVSQIWATR